MGKFVSFAVLATSIIVMAATSHRLEPHAAGGTAMGCDIKGNISFDRAQKIYHMPGQHYYEETVINGAKGERWFCSEEEARSAGWRKAGY